MARCPSCGVSLGVKARFKLYLHHWDVWACPKCKAPLRPVWLVVILLWIVANFSILVANYLDLSVHPLPMRPHLGLRLAVGTVWYVLFCALIPVLTPLRPGSPDPAFPKSMEISEKKNPGNQE